MIVTSGVIKVEKPDKLDMVIEELKKRSIKVDDVEEDKIIFIMETEAIDKARCEIEHIRDIKHVRDVYLLFYSFEDT